MESKVNYRLVHLAFALSVAVIILMYCPFPQDDFLRHVRYRDYLPYGGYAYMYPDSFFASTSISKCNPWFGFDHVTGLIKNMIGKINTVVLYETVFGVLFYLAVLVNIGRESTEEKEVFYSILATLIVITPAMFRIFFIRPASLMCILFFFALRGRRFLTGFLSSIFMAFLYYLFPFYTIILAVAHYLKGSKRFCTGLAAGTVLSVAAWIMLTDAEYLKVIMRLYYEITQSRDTIASENRIPIMMISETGIFLILAVFVFSYASKKEYDIYLVAALLTLPLALQTRYFVDLTVPLMGIYGARHNQFKDIIRESAPLKIVSMFAVLLLIQPSVKLTTQAGYAHLVKGLNIPAGSTVYCDSQQLGMSVVFWNEHPVRVIPSPASGWNSEETRKTTESHRENKKIEQWFCDYAHSKGINYLLSLRTVEADCVRRIETFYDGKMRADLWQVQ